MKKTSVRYLLGALLLMFAASSQAAETPLDEGLKPADDGSEVAPVLKDMGVVQKKSMEKAGKFLFSNYFSMDFSDGPYSNYGFNFDFGYAISDFWEVYLSTVPFYVNQQRSIVDTVQGLTLANGQKATITGSKAQHAVGGEVLWAPLYGKDSFGTRNVIRSDTFLKFGMDVISYDVGSGMNLRMGVGKTFFVGSRTGIRATAAGNYTQQYLNGDRSFKWLFNIEVGYVLYLF